MILLNTPRLALREFTIDDTDFVIELLNSESYLKYIGRRNINTSEEAVKYITDNFENSYIENGFGFYVIQLKDKKSPIGICGLAKRDWLDDIDLGFALLPDFEKNGYAYEVAAAMLNYSFTVLHFRKIVAITQSNNSGSIKLLKKIGMKESITVFHPIEKIELMLFSCENPDR